MISAKRKPGIHMIQTAVTDFDVAMAIVKQHQIIKGRKPKKKTLRSEFAGVKGRQSFLMVTLSDRTVPGIAIRKKKPTVKAPPIVWSKAQTIEVYKSGWFKLQELSRRAKVSILQVKVWVYGPTWKPDTSVGWYCSACTKTNPRDYCKNCGHHWSHGLLE